MFQCSCSAPSDKKAIETHWVFSLTYDADGNVTRQRASLLEKWFIQVTCEEEDEVIYPVARYKSLRFSLKITVPLGYCARQ